MMVATKCYVLRLLKDQKRELLATNLTIYIVNPMHVLLARLLICSRSNHRPTGTSIWGRAVKYGVPVSGDVVLTFATLFWGSPLLDSPLSDHNNDNTIPAI
jgi:hypothetical protein